MFYELLKSRRSIRKYKEQEVEKNKVETILKSALMAPSSMDRKPWEFIAVTDKDKLEKLSKCKKHGASFLDGAPLGIVVVADIEKCDVWIEDASITATIIQLTVQSLGLGSCWIQIRERFDCNNESSEKLVRSLLEIPENYAVLCIISIGYPDEEKNSMNENELPYEKIHYNNF